MQTINCLYDKLKRCEERKSKKNIKQKEYILLDLDQPKDAKRLISKPAAKKKK